MQTLSQHVCMLQNGCGLIERILAAESNEPSLAFIRELETSQKDYTKRHVIYIM